MTCRRSWHAEAKKRADSRAQGPLLGVQCSFSRPTLCLCGWCSPGLRLARAEENRAGGMALRIVLTWTPALGLIPTNRDFGSGYVPALSLYVPNENNKNDNI